MDYETYETKCERIREMNYKLIDSFADYLNLKGIKASTIKRHCKNVDFYINTYLLKEEPQEMDSGAYDIDMFLGSFFIRKCMWSTPASIKTYATSIKKFYAFMLESDKIAKESYDYLCSDIKENLSKWQEDCAMYNDPYAPNPFNLSF